MQLKSQTNVDIQMSTYEGRNLRERDKFLSKCESTGEITAIPGDEIYAKSIFASFPVIRAVCN